MKFEPTHVGCQDEMEFSGTLQVKTGTHSLFMRWGSMRLLAKKSILIAILSIV
jgi:hypothetical protein